MLDKLFKGAVILLAIIGILNVGTWAYAQVESRYFRTIIVSTEVEIGSSGTLDCNGTADIETLQIPTSAPSTAVAGSMYLDNDTLKVHNGTSYVVALSGTNTGD